MRDVSRHSDDKAGWFMTRQIAIGLDGCVVQRKDAIRCLELGCKVWGNADPLTESQLNSARGWFGNAGRRLIESWVVCWWRAVGGAVTAQLLMGLRTASGHRR